MTYRAPIQLVEGGYEFFIMMYPTHCTNPSVQAPQQNNNDIETIDDIEYPSIHDITMKEDISAKDFKPRPDINRASKPAALRTYDQQGLARPNEAQTTKPIAEIMRDQAEFLQRAEQNDAQLESASKMWKRQATKGDDLNAAENQELHFRILQLESKALDNVITSNLLNYCFKRNVYSIITLQVIENNRLRDELDRLKEEQRMAKQLSAKELEATRNIETKIKERQRLDDQHELERQERERQLAIAREAKKAYKPSTPPIRPFHHDLSDSLGSVLKLPGEEMPPMDPDPSFESSRVERPTFDRAMKPQPRSEERPLQRVRDFSPVAGHNVVSISEGLTGLLGLLTHIVRL